MLQVLSGSLSVMPNLMTGASRLNTSLDERYLSLSEIVFRRIKRAILAGEVRQGDQLTEVQLVDKLRVSKTPIREAFRRLEQEGLLRTVPNKGCFVVAITLDDLIEIFTIRLPLEVLAVSQAIQAASEEEVQKLVDIAQQSLLKLEAGDIESVRVNQPLFHHQLYTMAHLQRLENWLLKMRDLIQIARYVVWEEDSGVYITTTEHKAIACAIAERNPESAENLMRIHLNRGLESLKARRNAGEPLREYDLPKTAPTSGSWRWSEPIYGNDDAPKK